MTNKTHSRIEKIDKEELEVFLLAAFTRLELPEYSDREPSYSYDALVEVFLEVFTELGIHDIINNDDNLITYGGNYFRRHGINAEAKDSVIAAGKELLTV